MGKKDKIVNGLEKKIADRFKLLLEEQGMTCGEAAKIMRVNKYQVDKYKSGVNRLPLSRLLILLSSLEISASSFFDEIDY